MFVKLAGRLVARHHITLIEVVAASGPPPYWRVRVYAGGTPLTLPTEHASEAAAQAVADSIALGTYEET